MLAFPIVLGRDVSLAVARRDFVEGVEGADTFAGSKVFNLNPTLGQFRNTGRQPLRAGAEAREVTTLGRNDNHFLAALGNRGSRERRGGNTGRAGYGGIF
jgi:hypothetical protein